MRLRVDGIEARLCRSSPEHFRLVHVGGQFHSLADLRITAGEEVVAMQNWRHDRGTAGHFEKFAPQLFACFRVEAIHRIGVVDNELPFAADFDDSGTRDLVEVKQGDNCMLPGRGRSCSGYAIGYIPKKFPTWDSFASATLEEVYGHKLGSAEKFEARVMRSQLIVNNGNKQMLNLWAHCLRVKKKIPV